MAIPDSTSAPAPGNPEPAPFVAADPLTAPVGFGSGTISAEVDFRVVALIIDPPDEPALRMLLTPDGAAALARQLSAAAGQLADLAPRHNTEGETHGS